MAVSNDELIRSHYQKVAEAHGGSPRSTMEDDYVREKELEWILRYRESLRGSHRRPLEILDLGCGNGYTLEKVRAASADDHLSGVDFSEDLLAIACSRNLPGCSFAQGDARRLAFDEGTFDFVYTERCLINILDEEGQATALREIARVLKPGGDYLMIECFTDGLANNNKARADCHLPAIQAAYHNRYFEKDSFHQAIAECFTIVDTDALGFPLPWNFLSSYYFVSRVLYPSLLNGGEVVRNSEVAKFFSFLPPMGNYCPIQAFVLRKR